jgi:hypothetical protein
MNGGVSPERLSLPQGTTLRSATPAAAGRVLHRHVPRRRRGERKAPGLALSARFSSGTPANDVVMRGAAGVEPTSRLGRKPTQDGPVRRYGDNRRHDRDPVLFRQARLLADVHDDVSPPLALQPLLPVPAL